MRSETGHQQHVECIEHCAEEAATVWNMVRDFCGLWHPAVERIDILHDSQGAMVRALHVAGDDTVYRERLDYFSDSDRTYSYRHISGISNIEDYCGRMTVLSLEQGGCSICMSATVTAAAERALEVATGTRIIFDAGIAELIRVAESQPLSSPVAAPQKDADKPAAVSVDSASVTVETVKVESSPELAVDVTANINAKASSTLCLFLHGIGGNRTNWSDQLRHVASQFLNHEQYSAENVARANGEKAGSDTKSICLAAMDLRGYGQSAAGSQQSTVDDYCNDILRVQHAVGADKLILCGLSYGAWIATSFAVRYPDALTGLVLSGGCTGMSEADTTERDAFRQSREVPLNEGKVPADFAPAVVDVLAGPDADANMRQTLLQSMAAIPASTYRDALYCFTNPPQRFDFSALSMPVLMMTGEFDRLAPPAEIRAVAQRIQQRATNSDVRFEIIDRAGHLCNLEKPQQYNRILSDFLRRLSL